MLCTTRALTPRITSRDEAPGVTNVGIGFTTGSAGVGTELFTGWFIDALSRCVGAGGAIGAGAAGCAGGVTGAETFGATGAVGVGLTCATGAAGAGVTGAGVTGAGATGECAAETG